MQKYLARARADADGFISAEVSVFAVGWTLRYNQFTFENDEKRERSLTAPIVVIAD